MKGGGQSGPFVTGSNMVVQTRGARPDSHKGVRETISRTVRIRTQYHAVLALGCVTVSWDIWLR